MLTNTDRSHPDMPHKTGAETEHSAHVMIDFANFEPPNRPGTVNEEILRGL
jgi:hypothetical protein